MMHTPNDFRVHAGRLGSTNAHGNNGMFFVPNRLRMRERVNPPLRCIASDGEGWEHVSVSLPERCPVWQEMDYVKRLFWDDTDAVMQLHAPRATWVNNHPYCLHLWRPTGAAIPLPDPQLVGLPGLEPAAAKALVEVLRH